MVTVTSDDLLAAFEFVGSAQPMENNAYICLDTGKIYWTSELQAVDEDVPDDLEASDRYIAIPHKKDLDLGQNVALRFVAQELPVVLEGEQVRLEPMHARHVAGLWAAAEHADIWRWLSFTIRSKDQMRQFVESAVQKAENRQAVGYAAFAKPSAQIVGATGYWNIETAHRKLEIGASWLNPKWQRSGVNTEMKYLMLKHAFENLNCLRVEFKTDALNAPARAALQRIGATEEGVLRNHLIQPDGRIRNSVFFSIIQSEWPQVKERLQKLMAK